MRLAVTILGTLVCLATWFEARPAWAGYPVPSTAVEQPDNLLMANAPPLPLRNPIERDEIETIIKKYGERLRYCYEQQLQFHREMRGKVVVKFTVRSVEEQGRADPVEIETSELNNARVENCIVAIFKEMIFPEPRGGGVAQIRYPFIFHSYDSESGE